MPLQKFIKFFQQDTQAWNGIDPPEDIFFKFPITLINKPFYLRRVRIKINWTDNSRINTNPTDPDNPFQKWFFGNTLSWVLYKDSITSPQLFKFPSTTSETEFFPYSSTTELIDYGLLTVSKGPDVPMTIEEEYTLSFPENWFPCPNYSTEGDSASGNFPLTDGTGSAFSWSTTGFSIEAVDPSTPNPTTITIPDFHSYIPFNGGTTVDKYENCIDDLDILINGTQGELLFFTGSYHIPEADINTGQSVFATFEFFVQY